MRRRIILACLAALAVAGGAGAAMLATQSTVTATVTVPYTIAGQAGQVVVTHEVSVPTVTETVTQTVTTTTTTPTTTTPPPPPPTTTSTGQETISPSTFQSRATSGATISNVHVTGSVSIGATNVTVTGSTVDGSVNFNPSSSGSKLLNSKARGFNIDGADNIVLDGNVLDGLKQTAYNHIWDAPAGNTPSNWVIRNNTIQHFWVQGSSGTHSEGLFIGYSDHGLVENNTFFDNGNTGHIFFSWFGNLASSSAWPHDICLRGNTFKDDPNGIFHYYDVNIRGEINPTTANLKVNPSTNQFTDGVADSRLLAVC